MEQSMKKRDQSDDLRQHIDAWSGFVMSNLLWALVSLPLVTLPLATIGLMTVMSKRVRGRQSDLFETFFGAIRARWRKAMLIGLIDLAVGGLIVVNLTAFSRMNSSDPLLIPSGAVTLFVGLILLSANIYAWALLALENLPPRRLIEMSLRFALAYPLPTFAILIAVGMIIGISLLLPQGVIVLFTASSVAYVIAWGTWRVIRRHLTEDELKAYMAHHP